MNILKTLHNISQYLKLRRRLSKFSDSQQRALSQKIYEEAYNALKMSSSGDEYGSCSVVFYCPYAGHVSSRIERALSSRVEDRDDPTIAYDISNVKGDKWIASATVRANTQQDAMTMADACVMSAVLQSKTVKPSFAKYLSAVDENEAKTSNSSMVASKIHSGIEDGQ